MTRSIYRSDNMGQTVQIKAADGQSFDAYVAQPQGKPRAAWRSWLDTKWINPWQQDASHAGDWDKGRKARKSRFAGSLTARNFPNSVMSRAGKSKAPCQPASLRSR